MLSDPLMSYITNHKNSRPGEMDSAMSRSTGTRQSGDLTNSFISQNSARFDDLQFLHPIGEGSFGKVYLAMMHETHVAVKVLSSGSEGSTPGGERGTRHVDSRRWACCAHHPTGAACMDSCALLLLLLQIMNRG